MQCKSFLLIGCSLAGFVAVQNGAKAITIDGTLDSGPGGYGTILSTETNTSNSGSALPNNADAERSPSQNQLSNAYGVIDTANNQLDLFFGGAINLNDEFLSIAIDANPTTGVANLTPGVHNGVNDTGNVSTFPNLNNGNSNYYQIVFDPGFRPETLLTFQFDGGDQIFDDNLLNGTEIKDNYGSDPQNGPVTRGPNVGDPAGGVNFTVAVNNALQNTLETAATAPTATTGFEIGLNLTDLGYVAGSPINVAAFITQGSGTSMTNQVLGPNPGDVGDAYSQYNFDFTAAQGPGGHNAPGNQYFTVPAPEPATLSVMMVGGGLLTLRRRRNA